MSNNLINNTAQKHDCKTIVLNGTMDLKQSGILGKLVIFLRGCIRPVWCYFTLYFDYMVLSGTWKLVEGSMLERVLFLINFLVLGFIFGERTFKNVMPLILAWKKNKESL